MTQTTVGIETPGSDKKEVEVRVEQPQSVEEIIPSKVVQLAEVQPPAAGEPTMEVTLTLTEIGAIAASIQTCVHSGWIRQPSALNVVNSVLRKFHDVKLQYAKEHPA